MTYTVHHVAVLPHPATAVWEKLFDPDAATGWLGVAASLMPERDGAAFCWFYDAGSRLPTAHVGRVLTLDRPHRLVLLLQLPTCLVESTVTIELAELEANRTRLTLQHDGFPEDGVGPFEYDGWAHSWEHHLELLGPVRVRQHARLRRVGRRPGSWGRGAPEYRRPRGQDDSSPRCPQGAGRQ
ncbi:SRPBCC domain-containing protein [Solihabitans fulvus]|uniref:SRPBCC domain-containing protein n=1 Tax=Solihabitans fulvus TaxID=1892852 RepID=A0A5B2XBZ2_9PSEU|nr:SRPBCC domain-containing protein [Solihabitans fulvus]KAA2260469.1 SRPBCC domain-containing protein [Solihabitans fulvus]